MLVVDEQIIRRDDMVSIWDSYRKLKPFLDVNPISLAVCLSNPIQIISVVQFMKERGDTLLLIYGGTPLDAALRQAGRAGCKWLMYGDSSQIYKVEEAGLVQDASHVSSPPVASLLQFSSGTTGDPKVISRTWESIDEEILYYNAVLEQQGLDDAVPIILSSVSHSFGLITGVLASISRGITPEIYDSNNPKVMIRMIKRQPRHLIYGVPALLEGVDQWLEAWKIPLYSLVTSGAPMPEKLFEKLSTKTTCMIQQYGCTESGAASLAIGMKSCDDLGMALGHLRIEADETEPSEIFIHTTSDKVIATRDLGIKARDRGIRFRGRMDDLINVSGLKVQPIEVEEVIRRLNGIKEVIVYRGVHPVQGDRVLAKAIANEPITSQQVQDWCRNHLAEYKVPVEVQFVSDIPRLPSGKISRRLLEQEV